MVNKTEKQNKDKKEQKKDIELTCSYPNDDGTEYPLIT